ncbi:MAG: hypothetical protein U0232_29555 [Thermomicrobiales bacterium]
MGRRGESSGKRRNGAAPVAFRSPSIWRGARPRQERRRAATRNLIAAYRRDEPRAVRSAKTESELPLARANILVTAAAHRLATS